MPFCGSLTGVKFVGRKAERSLLESQFAAPRSAFVPIYGRRRVGKSELILQFVEGKKAIYHVGKTAPAGLQLRELLQQMARVLDEPLLENLPTDNWRTVFDEITRRSRNTKLVLAFDEFQWLVQAAPELPSLLQEFWDRHWSRSNDIMLILCGSYIGFMEREVLGSKSPLFGRRTAQIRLAPFSYLEAREFHPRWSVTDQASLYFLCGGVPHYLKVFDPDRSLASNVESVFLNEFSPLFREPDFLLREELREVDCYYAILLAIAEGQSTLAAIASRSSVPERSIPYYIQQLVELGYVARYHALTEKPANARHVRIRLEDPLLRFWFRFVFPNMSFLQQMGAARTFRERIKPELPAYLGQMFERLCREALPRMYARENVPAPFAIGEYWDKAAQIDVVGLRQDGWTDLGECKWGPIRSVSAVEAELETKVSLYPNGRNATIGRRIFSHHPVKNPGKGVRWTTLQELYELE